MKLGQKLVYILILILASSSSMASMNLLPECSEMPSMMKNIDAETAVHSMHEMTQSTSETDCCDSSSCPMSHCASNNIALTSTKYSDISPLSHYVIEQYFDLPLLLVINSHYRPPIALLS